MRSQPLASRSLARRLPIDGALVLPLHGRLLDVVEQRAVADRVPAVAPPRVEHVDLVERGQAHELAVLGGAGDRLGSMAEALLRCLPAHAEGRADRLPAPSGGARGRHGGAQQAAGLLVRPVRQHDQIEVRLRLALEAALDRRIESGDGAADQVGELLVVDRHVVNANLTTQSRQLDVDRLSGGRLVVRDHPRLSPTQLWIAGARPRTLPAAVAPVLAGTGAAAFADAFVWWKALLALGVSLSLQIGVNYANDYSDGIKGTDDDRVGPLRLVGSGLVPARKVKRAALLFLALGGALRLRPRGDLELVAPAGRRRRDRRGVDLHRRAFAVRLPGARRGQRLRVLRPRRGARHGVRADRATFTWLAVACCDRRRLTGLRDPGRQQPARHPDRLGDRQEDPGGRAG